jgi:hypothetical protein
MNPLKLFTIGGALLIIQACSHPIDIVGEGDVTSASGTRNCLLEDYAAGLDNCSKNYVVGTYQETYYATPRLGWLFDRWGNYCTNVTTNECSFNAAANVVQQFWGQTMPALQAVFKPYKVTGPVLPDSLISLGMGPQNPGYQKKEFFLSGNAQSYTPTLPLPSDGKLIVTANPEIAGGNYTTRLVVQRPIDPEDFNGTVIVEWLNVSAGSDSPPDWIQAHNEFVRSGYAWVGVSAQAVGVNAMKNGASTAARYASLLHPGDSYSYSIFSDAGLAAKEAASKLLGGLTADRVIAAGQSQSAFRLVTYIDAVHPLEQVYDGFLVHSRWGSGTPISQSPLPNYSFPAPAPIRDDLDVPVMIVQAEGDVIASNLDARQPDTAMIRLWEMAGTSHADAYTLQGLSDPGDGSGALVMFGYMRAPSNPFGCTNPINAGAHHWILQAAFHGLDTWVRTGVAPPAAPRIEVSSTSPLTFARDAYGNALGGVRSPQVDVPVATLDSVNSGIFFCGLFGRTIPFPVEQIQGLYSDKADFMSQWVDAINLNVSNGYFLPADAAALEAAADAWDFPN